VGRRDSTEVGGGRGGKSVYSPLLRNENELMNEGAAGNMSNGIMTS